MITTTVLGTLNTLGYIGPGGGITLLGPLLGVIVAIVAALSMIAFWPLRALWKRLRNEKQQHQNTP